MKHLILFAALLLFSFSANAVMSVETLCAPVVQEIDAGPGTGRITHIESLEIQWNEASPQPGIHMAVRGLDPSSRAVQSLERYLIKEQKSGTMVELVGARTNRFEFDGIYLEMGSPDVDTAGPLPPGIYTVKVSMAFIDSNVFYKKPFPMTVVKVEFDCQQTIKF